jgi:hypothetical protein
MKSIHHILTATLVFPCALLAQEMQPVQPPSPSALVSGGHGSGQGFRPKSSPILLQHLAPREFGASGTFSAWMALDDPSSASGAVFSAGTPAEGWILMQIDEGKLNLLIQKGEKPFQKAGECYVNLSIPISDWSSDSWHHVAVVWDAQGPNESRVATFIDGKLMENRSTLTLAPSWGPAKITIGANGARANNPKLEGVFDDVAVYGYPLDEKGVAELFKGNPTGAALYLDFEQGYQAIDRRGGADDAAARAASRAKWAQ